MEARVTKTDGTTIDIKGTPEELRAVLGDEGQASHFELPREGRLIPVRVTGLGTRFIRLYET
jgi:hypothetical protein